jgi:hypothetical protein
MQKLGQNEGGYRGETIDIHAVLRDCLAAAREHDWSIEQIPAKPDLHLLAFTAPATSLRTPHSALRIYVSTGIHGDEPAGPLAARRLLHDDAWPANAELCLLPCLNPTGFPLNRRANAQDKDLNRDYRHVSTPEVQAHIAWLERQTAFDLTLCLHEDWEARGFYLYELNPDHRPSAAEQIIQRVRQVCPIDPSDVIEGREARGGIIRPTLNPADRPQWPEAFYLITHKTRLSYTLEAPSDFPLPVRVAALVEGVRGALAAVVGGNG